MNRYLKTLVSVALTISAATFVYPQTTPNTGAPAQVQRRPAPAFDLAEYGVELQPDSRLIVMMAALDAAGFDPTPAGQEPSVFRAQVRRDQATLDSDLRQRLRTFYERNKLPAPATAADQAARYVSLAFALDPAPSLEAPARADDLPGGLLEVLDFAPLLKEFYRKSGIDERLIPYTRAYQAEGDRLRQPTSSMVSAILSYLHTRPITITTERVASKAPGKKSKTTAFTLRQGQRRFLIVPDLLAAPGAINLRIIGEDYYVVLPAGTDPQASELQRAYLQYVVDPLMLRFNRSIAERREQIKQVIITREKSGSTVTPDVFLVVSRSLVAAADARFEEVKKLDSLAVAARQRLDAAKDEATKASIAKEVQAAMSAVRDETIGKLADEYERGAVLAFWFADQLKGVESSGFDIANFFEDIISSFDPVREEKRLAENADARQRALAARQARVAARSAESELPAYSAAEAARAAALVKQLSQVEELLRLKDYPNAEVRLKDLMKDNPREPRIFFALAQTASLGAADATDEDVQSERLNRALANYRLAVAAASPETDRGLISRAHEAMGRIYSFQDNMAEAAKEFDAAIKLGDVRGGAYKEAVENRKKLP